MASDTRDTGSEEQLRRKRAYDWAMAILEWRRRHNGYYECIENAKRAVRESRECCAKIDAMLPERGNQANQGGNTLHKVPHATARQGAELVQGAGLDSLQSAVVEASGCFVAQTAGLGQWR